MHAHAAKWFSHISAKKRRANRRNAKKSTGPRSEEGKAKSKMNATTHGFFCADLVLPGRRIDVPLERVGFSKRTQRRPLAEPALATSDSNM